ncbi:two-component sensor histidine kinase [Glutamicibacter uratoxydans]|uniref:Two-component sensor histidine kinase n=1 Tax=Glutamicibacter uratoxydans TaxID=43667 RepID=A0A4Y4DVD6_GLUUR|nr:sensor histidine kinase [Glutamicibacter uratoxydans]GED06371.1 two-component sensor histidine kinase [Glutamicibacter uratoxydans]
MDSSARPWPLTANQHHLFASPTVLRGGQHLVTAILLVIALLRQLTTVENIWPVVVSAGAFAVWYVAGFIGMAKSHAQRLPLWWLAGLLGLWAVMLWVSPEFMWLAFSLWLLLGHQLPFLPSIIWSVVVYAMTIVAPYLHQGQTNVAAVAGPMVGGIFAWGISRGYLMLERDAQLRQNLVDSLIRTQDEMAQVQEELARSQHEAGVAAERTRLAREIHDTIAQQLSSIGLHAKAGLTAQDLEKSVQSLQRVDELSGQALGDLRRIIAALAPAELDTQALGSALERILKKFEQDTGISTRLTVDEGLPVLEPSVQIALLRTAQSALSNVQRHSHAGSVVINLSAAAHEIRMDIVDDGVGFTPATIRAESPTQDGGYGLKAMAARLTQLGGGLDVESSPGDGTALCAHLPLLLLKENK